MIRTNQFSASGTVLITALGALLATAATALAAVPPAPSGPKRVVAVTGFGGQSEFLAQYGLTEAGGGLAAMLATALWSSGRFVVAERADLSEVLSEQQLAGAGLATRESGPAIGRLTGATWIVTGDVTEFGAEAKGRGLSLGFAGLGAGRLGLSPQSRTGVVGLDVRVVDATTAQIVAAFHVREEVRSRALKVDVGIGDLRLGSSGFDRTPLGLATRAAIEQISRSLGEFVAGQEWRGRVVELDGSTLAINAGSTVGVQPGDVFRVVRIARKLTDPESGQPIGGRRQGLGRVVVDSVEAEVAFGRFEPSGDAAPERGDLVLLP